MEIMQIIQNKKNEQVLGKQELEFVVQNYMNQKITDEQMSEFLFATIEYGMSVSETAILTQIMTNSGEKFDLSEFKNTIDKHSTGGVSDSTTLLVVPLFALFGFTSIKMSGGSLSHTGGTAEKIRV